MPVPDTVTEEQHRAALAAMRSGDTRAAHQHCLAILKRDPRHADAWFICGVIAAQNGQAAKSADIIRRAIALAPDNAEYLAELAKQLIAQHRTAEALATAREALELEPRKIPVLGTLGTVFSHGGDHDLAVSTYERAAKLLDDRRDTARGLSPEWRAELYYNLGTSLNFAGRPEEAETAFETAINLQPDFCRAHFALSQLQPATPERNHLPRLQSLITGELDPIERLHVGHALARELEDLGQYAKALHNLRWAKEARAKQVDYRPDQDGVLFDAVESGFGKSLFEKATPGCDSAEPIFVVGMPRTGTTLVERILASHSAVFAAGELHNFPLQVKRLTGTASSEVLDEETLMASPRVDPAALGRAYIDSTRPRTGHTARFVDKLPLNFLYLGLIRLALPNAKLVCLRRDPMDTCLSNYRQLFATSFTYYHFSYDLLDCGRYYLRFDHLMRHWQAVMPGAVHEVRYEKLVAEPERCARELLAFCGLPWEQQCLDFHRQLGSVATASAAQVRQPIYRDAVNRWQRYGEALQPLYELLSSAGCYP
jgi:tetratricopeptide (TPR) repeat protein